jgi:hypothetical protein
MKKVLTALVFLSVLNSSAQRVINREDLADKIKGGWAGQTIGVSLGAPYEFRFSGSFIQDYQPLTWRKGYVKELMTDAPGIYDDLYMDLTFVDVFEKFGLDAPVDSFANAFANADYQLWHANQAARYNILKGIKAPESGNWKNNPHANDIDFQIESDFAGLMSPGMPATAAKISDRIGHIMNYGDGWYGGVFVSTMYTQAFLSKDIRTIINESLNAIPKGTKFHTCISDVIKWNKQYPSDWHQTWLQIQKKWSSDMYCPDGVFHTFDIDATINSAYVVLGLLYGEGDFGKSMEITTRAGQDADCNPSTVAGILGTMIGYNRIPAKWKEGLEGAESINFKYTDMSLNKVYEIGLKHALLNIEKNGGKIGREDISIPSQSIAPVALEQGYSGLTRINSLDLKGRDMKELSFSFTGKALVIKGNSYKKKTQAAEKVIRVRIRIDENIDEIVLMPTDFKYRKHELYWNYDLPDKVHQVSIQVLDPDNDYGLDVMEGFYY